MGRLARVGSVLSLLVLPSFGLALAAETAILSPTLSLPAPPFVAMSPCRLADTRGNGFLGAYGPPSMTAGTVRDFPVVGQCGIPADATGVSFNFTVVRTMGLGYVVAYPEGTQRPATSNVNYVAGQVVANSSIVELGNTGAISVEISGQQTDLIIDVNGYYAGTIVASLNGMSGELALVAGSNMTITPSGGTLTLSATSVPGPAGPQGIQGIAGAEGTDGAAGAQGPAGADGTDGSDGVSMTFVGAWDVETIYAINETVSYNGSSFVSRIAGNIGHAPDLSPIEWGMMAQRGADGADGAPGLQGLQGPQGPLGLQGLQGIQGFAGLNGNDGATGPAGADGTDGSDGVSMTFLGAWDVETIYAINETVSYNGSSFVSRIAGNIGQAPDVSPAAWGMMAQQGATGATGPAGADGVPGPQGIQGPIGLTGDTGVDGPAGPQGVPGPQGPRGPRGYHASHMLNGTTLTVYLSAIASNPIAPTPVEIAAVLALVTTPCTMTRLSVFATSALDAATTETYTLRVGTAFDESLGTSNLVDQPLSCTIGTLGNACVAVGSVPLFAGDILDLRLDITGTAPGLHHAIVALDCE